MIGRGGDAGSSPVEGLGLEPTIRAVEMPVGSRHGMAAPVLVRTTTHIDPQNACAIPNQGDREQRDHVIEMQGDERHNILAGRLINRRTTVWIRHSTGPSIAVPLSLRAYRENISSSIAYQE